MHFVEKGSGAPLLLIHGLGGTHKSWSPIIEDLARKRKVIALDLPGHGATPSLVVGASIRSYANALEKFLRDENLIGVDTIGFGLGARITLELLRRGEGYIGNCVAISPTRFWIGWEKHYFYVCSFLSVRLLQFFQPLLKLFTHNPIGRMLTLGD